MNLQLPKRNYKNTKGKNVKVGPEVKIINQKMTI